MYSNNFTNPNTISNNNANCPFCNNDLGSNNACLKCFNFKGLNSRRNSIDNMPFQSTTRIYINDINKQEQSISKNYHYDNLFKDNIVEIPFHNINLSNKINWFYHISKGEDINKDILSQDEIKKCKYVQYYSFDNPITQFSEETETIKDIPIFGLRYQKGMRCISNYDYHFIKSMIYLIDLKIDDLSSVFSLNDNTEVWFQIEMLLAFYRYQNNHVNRKSLTLNKMSLTREEKYENIYDANSVENIESILGESPHYQNTSAIKCDLVIKSKSNETSEDEHPFLIEIKIDRNNNFEGIMNDIQHKGSKTLNIGKLKDINTQSGIFDNYVQNRLSLSSQWLEKDLSKIKDIDKSATNQINKLRESWYDYCNKIEIYNKSNKEAKQKQLDNYLEVVEKSDQTRVCIITKDPKNIMQNIQKRGFDFNGHILESNKITFIYGKFINYNDINKIKISINNLKNNCNQIICADLQLNKKVMKMIELINDELKDQVKKKQK